MPPFPTEDALDVMCDGAQNRLQLCTTVVFHVHTIFDVVQATTQGNRGCAFLMSFHKLAPAAWGRPVESVLAKISEEPVAAASLGQVHDFCFSIPSRFAFLYSS